MAKKKKINESIGGVVSRSPFSGLMKNTPESSKLSSIVEDIFGEQPQEKFDVRGFMKEVSNFNSYGNHIYREGNLKEVAEKLGKLAEMAQTHILSETDDWMDRVSINRNMKQMQNSVKEFIKTANEAQNLNDRLVDLYENIGFTLSKYYEINDCDDDYDKSKEVDSVREGTYQDFFRSALKKWGVTEPDQLDDEEKSKFFNYIDKNWSAEKETD